MAKRRVRKKEMADIVKFSKENALNNAIPFNLIDEMLREDVRCGKPI